MTKRVNINNAKYEASFGIIEQIFPCVGVEFAFAGRSNVGKSSLINKVLNRKSLARVSGMPGKTATINFYRLDDIRFVDLPGYGYAKVAKNEKSRFSELINGYFEDERQLELVFLLLDMRHLPNEDDKYMAAYLMENEIPFVAVLTKCDKLTKAQREDMLSKIPLALNCDEALTTIPFSAVTGEGTLAIKNIIDEIVSED